MTDNVSTISLLRGQILQSNATEVLSLLGNLREELNNNSALVQELTTPAVISELHRLLVEHLKVDPRAMMLKTRVPGRVRRAVLFVQAMENGVKRVVK